MYIYIYINVISHAMNLVQTKKKSQPDSAALNPATGPQKTGPAIMQSNIMLDIPAGSAPQAASKSKALPHHLDIIQLLENQVQFFTVRELRDRVGSCFIDTVWKNNWKNHRSGSDLALWKRDATRSHQPEWLPWLQERLIATWGWLKNINPQKCMDQQHTLPNLGLLVPTFLSQSPIALH